LGNKIEEFWIIDAKSGTSQFIRIKFEIFLFPEERISEFFEFL
jgi:hypothetical protein